MFIFVISSRVLDTLQPTTKLKSANHLAPWTRLKRCDFPSLLHNSAKSGAVFLWSLSGWRYKGSAVIELTNSKSATSAICRVEETYGMYSPHTTELDRFQGTHHSLGWLQRRGALKLHTFSPNCTICFLPYLFTDWSSGRKGGVCVRSLFFTPLSSKLQLTSKLPQSNHN